MKLSQLGEIPRDPNARWYSFTTGERVDEPQDGDWCILVGSATSRAAQRIARRETTRRAERADKDGRLPADVASEIEAVVTSEARALDWAGLEDEEGEAIPFSPAKFREVAKQYPELSADVFMWSIEVAAETAKRQKSEEGNSPAGSAGT